jgi:hypothetical protein
MNPIQKMIQMNLKRRTFIRWLLKLIFDTYAYHCGVSNINVVLPEGFLARIPEVFNSRWALLKLRGELTLIKNLLGFGYEDIQITKANHPELEQYNGMFLKDIATNGI